jgi:predicted transglutaminase-like cysteine proteinase
MARPCFPRRGGWRVSAIRWATPGLLALSLAALPGWGGSIERIVQAAQRLGPMAQQGAAALQATMAALAALPDEARLQGVNTFFNRRLVFADDTAVYGRTDHWASPLEALQHGRGDCEDYAIAKYFTLVALGMPHERLRLVYVRAALGGPGGPVQPHMVLAYYADPGAEPAILDNLITEVRPASRRPDLTPVFSFNADGLWQGVGPTSAGDAGRLSRWREVQRRAMEEGFL